MPLILIAIAIFVSVSAYAQSDETCIAYMEADAAFEPSKRAYLIAEAAVDRAFDSVEREARTLRSAHAALETAELLASFSTHEANEVWKKLVELEGAKVPALTARVETAKDEWRKAWDEWRKARGELGVVASSISNAIKLRNRSYSAAYEGPMSDDDTVMNKLLAGDRERCRRRLE